jgi:predicted DNA-binding protein YlxM (UPF0122 family)
MELEKTKYINDLIDLYGMLLTKNQLNVLELYYMEDLSLKEISEELNVSRNAVYDSLKRSVSILENYEKNLKLIKRENIKNELIEKYDNLSKEEIREYIERL